MGDVLWLAEPTHGDPLVHRLLTLRPIGLPLPLVIRACAQKARRHGVHGNAARPELVCQLAHEAELRRLGRGIRLDAGQADPETGAASDHDNAALALSLHTRRDGAAG